MYNNFQTQRTAILEEKIDLIYANPYEAAMLVREQGFKPLVKPENAADEAIIAVNADSSYNDVTNFKQGIKVAMTADHDVNMIGMIMLEPADLNNDNIELQEYGS